MLRLEILGEENWDKDNEVFVYPDRKIVKMEHSLVSLSKWESKFEKPFLTEVEKTSDEILYYVECMILDDVDPSGVIPLLTKEHVERIQEHIDAKQTATWFTDTKNSRSTQTITNELIYYWMFTAGIDKSCEHWHLNRLFTQIRVHSAHNADAATNGGKKKRMTQSDAAARAAENQRRRELYGSKG